MPCLTSRYYQPTGRVGVMGVLLYLILGAGGAFVLAAVYAFAISAFRLVYVLWVAPFVLAGALGWLIGKTGRLARVQNVWAEFSAGCLAGLLAVYVGWVFWIGAMYDLNELIFDLGGLFRAMAGIAGEGIAVGKIWVENKSSFSGWTLWLMWTLEALVIVGGTGFFAVMRGQGEAAYCAHCKKWCEEKTHTVTYIPEDREEEITRRLEAEDYSVFDEMHRVSPAADKRTEITLIACPNCKRMRLLSIRTIDTEFVNDYGTPGISERDVLRNLYVPARIHQRIRSLKRVEGEEAEQETTTVGNDPEPS